MVKWIAMLGVDLTELTSLVLLFMYCASALTFHNHRVAHTELTALLPMLLAFFMQYLHQYLSPCNKRVYSSLSALLIMSFSIASLQVVNNLQMTYLKCIIIFSFLIHARPFVRITNEHNLPVVTLTAFCYLAQNVACSKIISRYFTRKSHLLTESSIIMGTIPLIFTSLTLETPESLLSLSFAEIQAVRILLFSIIFVALLSLAFFASKANMQVLKTCSLSCFAEVLVIMLPRAKNALVSHRSLFKKKICKSVLLGAVSFAFALLAACINIDSKAMGKSLMSKKVALHLRRKFFHVALFLVVYCLQDATSSQLAFQRLFFPLGITLVLIQSVFMWTQTAHGAFWTKTLKSFLKKDERQLVRSPLYLLYGSAFPLLLFNPRNYETLSDTCPLAINLKLLCLSGFVLLGISDSCAAIFGTIFGASKISLKGRAFVKTWEGLISAYFGAFFGFSFLLRNFSENESVLLHNASFLHAISLLSASVEAFTDIDDNLILPPTASCLWILLLLRTKTLSVTKRSRYRNTV